MNFLIIFALMWPSVNDNNSSWLWEKAYYADLAQKYKRISLYITNNDLLNTQAVRLFCSYNDAILSTRSYIAVSTLAVGTSPRRATYNPNNNTVVISNFTSGNLSIVD